MEASPDDSLHDPYLSTLYITTPDHINIYNKAIIGLPEIERYELTISKWTDFTNNRRMLYLYLY